MPTPDADAPAAANPAHRAEPSLDERFGFGANWKRFLEHLSDERIREARDSLRNMLGRDSLEGLRLLDVGCGSGLFSLAARQLGASVQSFDFDPDSVECAQRLKQRFYPDDPRWSVSHGSVLDEAFVAGLGDFDIVYAWGVLHHTGAMWPALENAAARVGTGGSLFIALYNDQGRASRLWKRVKRFYCSGTVGRLLVTATFVPLYALAGVVVGLLRHGNPLGYFTRYRRQRGMSVYHDWIDWLGGFPFEVATPGEVLDRLVPHGFILTRLVTTNGSGCNEFVFRRETG